MLVFYIDFQFVGVLQWNSKPQLVFYLYLTKLTSNAFMRENKKIHDEGELVFIWDIVT